MDPFPDVDRVNGVTYDGQQVWFASGDKLIALDPASGKTVGSIDVASHAGTAFDGQHLAHSRESSLLVTPVERAHDETLGAVREWLLAEAGQSKRTVRDIGRA